MTVAIQDAPRVAVAPPSYAMPKSIADIQVLGEMMVASGFFKDIKSSAQACVKILAGAALGYDPFTSMNAFHIIEGKVCPTAGEIAARIKRSGKYDFRIERMEDDGCVLVFFQREDGAWNAVGKSEFLKADAVAAGLAGKDVWKKYPRNMYHSRALTNGARWFCPDVFGGPVYTAEELGADVAIDPSGEMQVVTEVKPAALPKPPRRREDDADRLSVAVDDAFELGAILEQTPAALKAYGAANGLLVDGKMTPGALANIEAALAVLDAESREAEDVAPEESAPQAGGSAFSEGPSASPASIVVDVESKAASVAKNQPGTPHPTASPPVSATSGESNVRQFTPKANPDREKDLRASIHILQRELELSDSHYRSMLKRSFPGKFAGMKDEDCSSADLHEPELSKFAAHLAGLKAAKK